jgi:hypothetical protein
LIGTVLKNDKPDESGWYWQLKNLPDAPETRYLYDLLASNAFQEALKNYRDLSLMQKNLDDWSQSLSAFQDMVDNRRLAFVQRTEAMKAALDAVDIDHIEAHTLELETRVSEVEREEDIVAVATTTEQANWRKVMAVEDALKHADATDPTQAEMRDKTRLLHGVLYWDMNANYKARLWREKKEVRELAVATKEARRRHTLVTRARDTVPQRNDAFGVRVTELAPRLQVMIDRCQAAGKAQGDYLAQVAIQQLDQQKQRLAQYSLQAQFALAAIYDRAADAGHGEGATQKSAEPVASPEGATPRSALPGY